MKKSLLSIALTISSVLLFSLLVEGAYRYWVFKSLIELSAPAPFDPNPTMGVFNPPPWEYDEEAGFRYTPNLQFITAQLVNGAFAGCSQPSIIANSRGNIGDIIGEWEDSDVRVMVLGDSFTSMNYDGKTWPNLFQTKLEDALDKKVRIVNLGRDAYGVVQMLDLAAREIEIWKPTHIIFAFITDDLLRPRHWRTVQKVGDHWRFLMSLSPGQEIDLANTHTNENAFVNPAVTYEWCENLKAKISDGDVAAAREDPLVKSLIAQYNDIRENNVRSTVDINDVDFWTLKHSFFYNRFVRGDTFAGTGVVPTQVGYYRMEIDDYRSDVKFLKSLSKIHKSGVKIALVHLPVTAEVEKNKEYIWLDSSIDPERGQSLIASLEQSFAAEVLGLVPIIRRDHKTFSQFTVSDIDQHPNAKGIHIYAHAVATALAESGFFNGP